MSKYFFGIIFLFNFSAANAQFWGGERILNQENFDKKRWSWGYFLGYNSYDFKFDYNRQTTDVKVEKVGGFNVGLIGNMRINDYLDLRLEPGVIFANRNISLVQGEEDSYREVKSTYVHIPLLLKVSTKRLNNIKPFIVGGVSTSINLSSNEKNPDDNTAGQFRMKTNTYYYELGFGIDLYLYYFKFTPSIRGVFALSDELVPDNNPESPYTRHIDKMATRGVFINFTFQ
ncbi:MAG TPA: porin family protein [Salinimicrobium sp.]|nr:porin family protein [Salinimicrobium sp.]